MSEKRVFRAGADGAAEVDHTETVAEPDPKARTLQAMTFSTHIMSLNAMALMHLGAMDGGPELTVDLEAAQHLIDTLAMLREKTTGNLDGPEERLLDSVLYDLRVKFVQAKG